jgi:hypothetical protein
MNKTQSAPRKFDKNCFASIVKKEPPDTGSGKLASKGKKSDDAEGLAGDDSGNKTSKPISAQNVEKMEKELKAMRALLAATGKGKGQQVEVDSDSESGSTDRGKGKKRRIDMLQPQREAHAQSVPVDQVSPATSAILDFAVLVTQFLLNPLRFFLTFLFRFVEGHGSRRARACCPNSGYLVGTRESQNKSAFGRLARQYNSVVLSVRVRTRRVITTTSCVNALTLSD